MLVKICKSQPKGEIIAPPSKSYSHRYLLGAMLADNDSVISNIYCSEDIMATLNCMPSFGRAYKFDDNKVFIRRCIDTSANPVFNCNESGSTLRFIIPIAMTQFDSAVFIGTEKLISRGISVYEDIFAKQAIKVNKFKDKIIIEGRLKSGYFEVDGSISSQFITGLLYALPLLNGDSVIKLIPPINSKDYIDMTLKVLSDYQIKYEYEENQIKVFGNQKYKGNNYSVEGDYSNAAFLEALNYLGGKLNVNGLIRNSLQGDKVYREYFEKLDDDYCEINIENCIDLGPVLMVFAALKNGAKFTGTKRLAIKESNRAMAIKEELIKVGISVDVKEDEVIVYKGIITPPSTTFDSHNDHRIVMALSLLFTLFDIEIDSAEAVNKSYPNYFEELEKVGVKILYETK